MTTPRGLERLFGSRQFGRLSSVLTEMRPETSSRLANLLMNPLAAAAMAVIRLDELSQSHHPFAVHLLHQILSAQSADGSFGDPMVSALCLAALLCSQGGGEAVGKAISHLASLQREDGAFPAAALRRMPSDAYTTAFVLFHLAMCEPFAKAIRLDDAFLSLLPNEASLDPEVRTLARLASTRAGRRSPAFN